ncbi:pectate trisaccharide-lyase [Catenovulum sp. 2E275]|uniref:pectate lyase family protein n=1 Tax=Catenovulum sp. 2E275 TaxID=2980497 RepID=UPI0021CFD0D6|nr:pectate trisaccharide-lyase [Catenovulum sp. 2E275]MCU4674182.1 pectate trisaccharide-lyase [Catenovulum sp. 2E275]
MNKLYLNALFIVSAGLLTACSGGSSDTDTKDSVQTENGNQNNNNTNTNTEDTDNETPTEPEEPETPTDNPDTADKAYTATGAASLNGGTTGGEGGLVVKATTGTEIHQALCSRASSDTPIIIEIEGTINHTNTSKVSGDSCNTAEDVIELKEISNITLLGVGSGAVFDQIGIHIRKASNIIIQNVHVKNVKKSGSPVSNGGDAIGMESDVSNIWVDHVTLEASGGENEGFDALFDMKANSKYITLSYSILKNAGRGGLVGSTDGDSNNGPVTFHHNIYQNIDSRTPLLRHATAHAFNNHYDGLNESGMNPRIGGQIKAENNVFENAKNPLGTFYTNDMGYWDVSGNIWADSVTWSAAGDKSYPAGSNPESTTSIAIEYDYQLDDASCVKELLNNTAGANKSLAISDGSCGVTLIEGTGESTQPEPNNPEPQEPDTENPDPENPEQPTPSDTNFSLSAGADGSSKASGSSYGNVKDGDLTTYWSPDGTTGRISVKNLSSQINAINIIETSGSAGSIQTWRVINEDNNAELASGTGLNGLISFTAVSLNKISFYIDSANATPQIAEFETYYTQGNSAGSTTDNSSLDPTDTTDNSSSTTDETANNSNQAGGDDNGVINYPDANCAELINNPEVNWRESSLQSDQEIIECLATSLGKPVGYGENATGGYNNSGDSHLIIITNNKPEEQILAAISSTDYNWIVFDKADFKTETQIMMYRPYCTNASLQSALGLNETECRSPQTWCEKNNISDAQCLETFFNTELNNAALPIRNYVIASNTTIDGRGANATFVFNGFAIGADSSGTATTTSENVIITNNKFIGVGHTEDHDLDPDMIRSTGESHDIWIHQNTFDTTGDSAFDVKVGAYNISVSFNKLINVKRAALHGSSDSRAINSQIRTSIHNNLFVTTDEYFGASSFNTLRRVPLLRRGQTHLFNNVFYGYRKDILSVRVGGSALLDNNLIINNATNSKGDDLTDWQTNLFDEAVKEGNLEINNTYVFESNANCELSGNSASLDTKVGTTPNMFADYNSVSQNTINENLFTANDSLRDYVIASAGKNGMPPYLSSYSAGTTNIIAAAASSCQ